MHRPIAFVLGLVALATATACSRAPATTTVPPGGTHADAPEHPCTWFTADEIGARIGARVRAGQVAGPLGTSAQWQGSDDAHVSVQILIVRDIAFWALPATAAGYAALPGIGKAAYVVDSDGGTKASALLETSFVTVVVQGTAANRAAAERLLVDAVPRVR